MDPALMDSAIALTAINPELQNLLRHIVDVVTGNPAAKAAVRTLYPARGSRAFPRTISCTASGLIFDSPRTPWNQPYFWTDLLDINIIAYALTWYLSYLPFELSSRVFGLQV